MRILQLEGKKVFYGERQIPLLASQSSVQNKYVIEAAD